MYTLTYIYAHTHIYSNILYSITTPIEVRDYQVVKDKRGVSSRSLTQEWYDAIASAINPVLTKMRDDLADARMELDRLQAEHKHVCIHINTYQYSIVNVVVAVAE